jgi:hypothetical protein
MTDKQFHLRLTASYKDAVNDLQDLTVEVQKEDQWENLELDIYSPGFLLFINGLFSCQHLYMRTNAAECDVQLESATGELYIETDENWEIKRAEVAFVAKLRSGEVTDENLDYIIERMHHCPVSSNLPEQLLLQVSVRFE